MKQKFFIILLAIISLCPSVTDVQAATFSENLKVPLAAGLGFAAGILIAHLNNRSTEQALKQYTLEELSAGIILPEQKQKKGLTLTEMKQRLLPQINGKKPLAKTKYPLALSNTAESSHTLHLKLPDTLSDHKKLVLLSRGYSRSRDTSLKHKVSAYITAALIKNNLYSTIPCIFFDYHDQRAEFNCGGNKDAHALRLLLKKMARMIEQGTEGILHGICRGSTTALRCLTQEKNRKYVQHIKHVVLESPFADGVDLTNRLAESYFSKYFGSILNAAMQLWFPSYDKNDTSLTEELKQHVVLPHGSKILIAHLKGDDYISDETIQKIIYALQIARKKSSEQFEVYLAVFEDESGTIKHGQLSKAPAFQKIVDDFVNEKKSDVLALAKQNAEQSDLSEWKTVPTLVGAFKEKII